MMTRSVKSTINILQELKSNVVKMNTYMNLVTIYYRNNDYNKNTIIKLCLSDLQLNKIKNKRIIIYNNNNYDYAELLGYERILYDENIFTIYNKGNEEIINSIENNLLDDFTIDLLIEDEDIECANILLNIKYS